MQCKGREGGHACSCMPKRNTHVKTRKQSNSVAINSSHTAWLTACYDSQEVLVITSQIPQSLLWPTSAVTRSGAPSMRTAMALRRISVYCAAPMHVYTLMLSSVCQRQSAWIIGRVQPEAAREQQSQMRALCHEYSLTVAASNWWDRR